jgi:hypothetical protein
MHKQRLLGFLLSARQVSTYRACPPLASDIESTRGDLLAKMRVFAQQTNDRVFNDYLTVAMAPLGPGIVLGS